MEISREAYIYQIQGQFLQMETLDTSYTVWAEISPWGPSDTSLGGSFTFWLLQWAPPTYSATVIWHPPHSRQLPHRTMSQRGLRQNRLETQKCLPLNKAGKAWIKTQFLKQLLVIVTPESYIKRCFHGISTGVMQQGKVPYFTGLGNTGLNKLK